LHASTFAPELCQCAWSRSLARPMLQVGKLLAGCERRQATGVSGAQRSWWSAPSSHRRGCPARHRRAERLRFGNGSTRGPRRSLVYERRTLERVMELQDQRVLVTGATTGIGRETARLFARRGATVVITGRDTERGAQTVAAIEAEGGRAEFIAADLNDIESVRRLAEQVGDVDVLVNNAAVHKFAPTLEQDVESFDMTFDVSVKAP